MHYNVSTRCPGAGDERRIHAVNLKTFRRRENPLRFIDGMRPESQVRTGLRAGGRWIRTLGPPSEGCMQTPRSPPIASSRIALVDRDNPHKEVRFAEDSPLEGDGF